ncbi:Crp/Fnr family transcriptional regulator [Brevibacillus humidisoli]|uniref:Crp/Fnr family transcriptional regulator n=1 Tax=Brevibacillus humidisoli TaxID=2895522 RepID=UPI001E52145A|nr:Crp/Fnr family transcriptional regulator [Brevibacillus humidisoli]UFJ41764.1 Crp/Fnr family transcriptional regulator [Brevibacillus humidisoli]
MNGNNLSFAEQVSPDFLRCLETLAAKKTCFPGTVLFLDGEKADQVYFVQSGQVKLTKTTMDGKELTLQISSEGDLVGVTGLFEQELTYNLTASMLKVGELWMVPRQGLEKMLIKNSQFCVEFLRWLGMINRRMQSKFRDLLLHGKIGALYSTLIRMSNTYGKPHPDGILIDLSMTNKDLAMLIGLTRESVNRMLQELKKQEVIELLPYGQILIKNLAYLKEAIYCDDCPPEICQM